MQTSLDEESPTTTPKHDVDADRVQGLARCQAGARTGCSLRLLWVPTTLLLVQNTACTGGSGEIRGLCARSHTTEACQLPSPQTSAMLLSLSSRNFEGFQTSRHLILTSSQTQTKSLWFLPLSRSFISTHFISPVTPQATSASLQLPEGNPFSPPAAIVNNSRARIHLGSFCVYP